MSSDKWLVLENIALATAAACVLIFAPGWWKLGGLCILVFMNLSTRRKQ